MFALISNDYERWMISDNVVKETYYSHWAKNKNPWETHGKPTNPCCGYGFMVGLETTTHTHTHGTHTHNPHGFWNPLQSLPWCSGSVVVVVFELETKLSHVIFAPWHFNIQKILIISMSQNVTDFFRGANSGTIRNLTNALSDLNCLKWPLLT